MSLKTICQPIIDGYAAEKSALDDDMIQHVVDLADHAQEIIDLEAERDRLVVLIKRLHRYSHFDPTFTETSDDYRDLKMQARSVAEKGTF